MKLRPGVPRRKRVVPPPCFPATERPRQYAAPSNALRPPSRFEGQAKSRIEANGFANVSELRKDDQGVWRGKAMKDGKSVTVSLDFQGNVTAQ